MGWVFVVSAVLALAASTRAHQQDHGSMPRPAQRADVKVIAHGERLYTKYCATCHGKNREGHLTEHANALRTPSFLQTANLLVVDYAIRYGRPHTAMAPYYDAMGGPLNDADIMALGRFIFSFAPSPRTVTEPEPKIAGDAARGAEVYAARCQQCHGPDGAGTKAPSLNDRLFLAVSSPYFLRNAVAEGRDNTPMPAFKSILSAQQIDDLALYVKSWTRAWIKPDPIHVEPTDLSTAVLNPKGESPRFTALRADRYVSVPALRDALEANARLVVLDVRATSAWAASHIPGAVSLPYYDLEKKVAALPKDDTWIVAYCSCPTHLADQTVDTLRTAGFKHVATLDEGIAGWVARGYPLQSAVGPQSSK